jgi:quinol---cytochrome c reductase iron-sulfur subunit, bacillus type
MCDHGVGGLTPPPAPVSRRSALFKLGVGLNALAALLLGVPVVGYVASAVRRRGQQAWVSLGPVSNFPEHQTRLASYTNPFTVPWDAKVADIPCWVRRLDADRFQVFAINCTHLGCPVRWFQESGLFMCPCHGGVFYEDGRHASGPPPRPLYQYEHRIRDGKLEVRGGQIPTLSEPV